MAAMQMKPAGKVGVPWARDRDDLVFHRIRYVTTSDVPWMAVACEDYGSFWDESCG